jgi:hypothetical protein
LVSQYAPAAPEADALVIEVSDLNIPPNHDLLKPFQVNVVRVLRGKYDGSVLTIAPQVVSSCTHLTEEYQATRGYIVGTLVHGADGSLILHPHAQKPQANLLGL